MGKIADADPTPSAESEKKTENGVCAGGAGTSIEVVSFGKLESPTIVAEFEVRPLTPADAGPAGRPAGLGVVGAAFSTALHKTGDGAAVALAVATIVASG